MIRLSQKFNIAHLANAYWYQSKHNFFLLWPAMWIYRLICSVRRYFLIRFKQVKYTTPIIVVGNLTVGGVGKTPLVIVLVRHFQGKGLRVGVVSRGYRSTCTEYPHRVCIEKDTAIQVGDEPFLIALKTGAAVVIAPKRVDAVNALLKSEHCDLIISDDGLQHYAMGRAIEIVVVDGIRQFGNQKCIPAGPLREPLSRLKTVDFVIANTPKQPLAGMYTMHIRPEKQWKSVLHHTPQNPITQEIVVAVAGIGHPDRFFDMLQMQGIRYIPYIFPDHYVFQARDFVKYQQPIIMTEKDAVKCQNFATETMFFWPIEVQLEDTFWHALWAHPALAPFSETPHD